MFETDNAPLNVLFIGGTGAISAASVRLAVHSGMNVSVLNRGRSQSRRSIPNSVKVFKADITDETEIEKIVGANQFDAVVDFLSFGEQDAERAIRLWSSRARQYIQISSASIYGKPILSVPVTESTQVHNRFIAYSRSKIAAEEVVKASYLKGDLPVTIVRPSHTYDDLEPPIFGGWGIFNRIEQGLDVPVHGDGTSLWTLTHANDFAQALVGLLGNPRTLGETFNIVGDEVVTWNGIYEIMAHALGLEANLVHIPSEWYRLIDPDWWISDFVLGDLGSSLIFDNSKIKNFVPTYKPHHRFDRSVVRMLALRSETPELAVVNADDMAKLDRLAAAYHFAEDAIREFSNSTNRMEKND